MAEDASEILRTGDLHAYDQAYGSGTSFPTDSAWGTSPGGSWGILGFTNDGFDVNISMTYDEQHVDQLIYPAFVIGTAGDIHLVTNLLQVTAANIQKAIGGQGSLSTTAAESGTRGHTDLLIDGTVNVNHRQVYFDAKHPGDGEAVRQVLWNAIMRGNAQMKLSRAAAAQIQFDAQGLPDTANGNKIMTWRDVIPALP
jgi:hypothetical protein